MCQSVPRRRRRPLVRTRRPLFRRPLVQFPLPPVPVCTLGGAVCAVRPPPMVRSVLWPWAILVCTVLSWTVRRGAPRLGVWFALARSCTGFGPTRFFKLGCLSLAYVLDRVVSFLYILPCKANSDDTYCMATNVMHLCRLGSAIL